MWPFKCKHPASMLGVQKTTPTIEPVDSDFEKVTFHLHCWQCGNRIDVSCSRLIGGVEEFLYRTPQVKNSK